MHRDFVLIVLVIIIAIAFLYIGWMLCVTQIHRAVNQFRDSVFQYINTHISMIRMFIIEVINNITGMIETEKNIINNIQEFIRSIGSRYIQPISDNINEAIKEHVTLIRSIITKIRDQKDISGEIKLWNEHINKLVSLFPGIDINLINRELQKYLQFIIDQAKFIVNRNYAKSIESYLQGLSHLNGVMQSIRN